MRFGIALPSSGPMADDAAVAATARAAEQLEYDSVWSTSVRQLLVAVSAVERVPVGLLIPGDGDGDGHSRDGVGQGDSDGRDDDGVGDGGDGGDGGHAVTGAASTLRRAVPLGSRLRYVGARPRLHRAIRRELPGAILLDTSDRPPAGWFDPHFGGVDGWSPAVSAPGGAPADRRPAGSPLLLVLRVAGTVEGSVAAARLRDAVDSCADEIVVAFPDVHTLDEELAAFADVAERVASLGRTVDRPRLRPTSPVAGAAGPPVEFAPRRRSSDVPWPPRSRSR